jgi:hypothetical protein
MQMQDNNNRIKKDYSIAAKLNAISDDRSFFFNDIGTVIGDPLMSDVDLSCKQHYST